MAVDVNLKQWRDYGTKTVTVEEPKAESTTPTVTVEKRAGREHRSDGQDLHGKGRRLPLGHRGQILWQRGRVQQDFQRKHGQNQQS